jgi:hypothetical protein
MLADAQVVKEVPYAVAMARLDLCQLIGISLLQPASTITQDRELSLEPFQLAGCGFGRHTGGTCCAALLVSQAFNRTKILFQFCSHISHPSRQSSDDTAPFRLWLRPDPNGVVGNEILALLVFSINPDLFHVDRGEAAECGFWT